MPGMNVKAGVISQELENGTLIAEAAMIPDRTVLGDDGGQIERRMEARLDQFLKESLAGDVTRYEAPSEMSVREVSLEFEPPQKTEAWKEPITLKFHVVDFVHGSGMRIARVPELGISVVGKDEEAIGKHLEEQIKMTLQRTHHARSLLMLAFAQRCRKVTTRTIGVELDLKSPKELAKEESREDEKEKSVLDVVATQLTVKQLDPVWEREEPLDQLAGHVARGEPQSVLLVGPGGVGKTALVHALAERRAEFGIKATPIWSTTGARIVAGMTGYGMWQERCTRMVKETSSRNGILHLGNLAELLQVGRSVANEQGIASFLRPRIGSGELLAIAECSPEQITMIERQDPHLLSVFARVDLKPLSGEPLNRVISRFAETQFPKAKVATDAREAVVRLHDRFATYSVAPGRHLRFLGNLLDDFLARRDVEEPKIHARQVNESFSSETGLPLFMLDDAEPYDLGRTEKWFSQRVIGQPEAVKQVTDLIAITKARMSRPSKPIGALLFIGPTGVGKTEMAKALANHLFGSDERMVRFDMSEFSDPNGAARLIDGTSEGEGLLTAKVREQPFCVLLLDEFEKAHPNVFDLLLQVFGEGRLTDGAGRLADFRNSVIIMTSNLGAQSYQQGALGFAEKTMNSAREHFASEVQKFLRPEMFNRIDAIVPFDPLTGEVVRSIARREVEAVGQRDGIVHRGVTLETDESVIEHLSRKGFDARYGARPLRRAVERELIAPLATALNESSSAHARDAVVSMKDGRIHIKVRARCDDDGRPLPASGATREDSDDARNVSRKRRLAQKLEHCPTIDELNNGLSRLESSLERTPKSPAFDHPRRRLQERIFHTRAILERVNSYVEQAIGTEVDVLTAFHAGDPAGEIAREQIKLLEDELNDLLETIYLHTFEHRNEVLIAIFGEHTPTIFELARAYTDLAENPELTIRHVKPSPRQGEGPKHAIEDVDDPWKFLKEAPEPTLGVVIQIKAKDIWPRLHSEGGWHRFESAKETRPVAVFASDSDPEEFVPPPGIELMEGIVLSADCRTYSPGKNQVIDEEVGTFDWPGSLRDALREATRLRYRRSIASILK